MTAEGAISVPFPQVPREHVSHLTSELVSRISRARGPRCRLVDNWKSVLEQCVDYMVVHGPEGLAGWVVLQLLELCEEGDLFTEAESKSLSRACVRHLVDLGLQVPEADPTARARQAGRLLGSEAPAAAAPVGAGRLGNLLSVRSAGRGSSRRR